MSKDFQISVTKTTAPKSKPTDENKLGFGKIFTDHMFIMIYKQKGAMKYQNKSSL